MRILRLAVLASVAMTMAGVREAKACSCAQQLFGGGRLYVGAGDVLPADAPGFPWTGPESIAGSKDRVTVVLVEGKRKLPVKYTISEHAGIDIIVPAKPFAPGQVYEVKVRESAAAAQMRKEAGPDQQLPPPETTTKVTIAAEPLKLTEASVRAGPQVEEFVSVAAPASCSEGFGAAQVPLRVELPPELEPLRNYLIYVTRVDGVTWDPQPNLCTPHEPGRSWTEEPGTNMVFAVCKRSDEATQRAKDMGGFEYPKPGKHKIEVVIATPDQVHSITTPAIEVELTCAKDQVAAAEPAKQPAKPPPREPPPVERRGCAIGDPGFAWVLGVALLARRRRRSNECP